MFDVSTFFVEVLFLVIGLTLGGWAAVQARRAQKTNAVKVLTASGITLQTAGLLFAAVGWLMLASDLSGQRPWTMIMPAAALLCAWLFPWRAVLFAALLSPLYVNMPLPGAVAWSDVLFLLTLLTGLSVLFGKSAAQRAEALLPALLAAVWTSGLLQPESLVHQPVPTGHFAQTPSIGFMAAAALLLIVCLRGLTADRHRSISLQRGAAFIAAAAAAVAAVWMLPAASRFTPSFCCHFGRSVTWRKTTRCGSVHCHRRPLILRSRPFLDSRSPRRQSALGSGKNLTASWGWHLL